MVLNSREAGDIYATEGFYFDRGCLSNPYRRKLTGGWHLFSPLFGQL